MRILVYEHLCGGGWPPGEFPASLLREGRAMLSAIVGDLTRLPNIEVVVPWDERCGAFALPQVRRIQPPTGGPNALLSFLEVQAAAVDAILVIAPELDGALLDICARLSAQRTPLWNCAPEAIALTGDKGETFLACRRAGLPTIPTEPVGAAPPWLPAVVKRRDGAGSSGTRLIRSFDEWELWRREVNPTPWIVQPFLRGRSLSAAAIFDRGMLCQVWPVAEQRLRRDGFEYLGGQIPAVDIPADLAAQLISRCRVCISGLHGYVGFDFLAPEESPEELLLVEINPRLTTSYVGYREASRDNLAAWIMNPSRQPGPTFSGRVAFAANGDILERDA